MIYGTKYISINFTYATNVYDNKTQQQPDDKMWVIYKS